MLKINERKLQTYVNTVYRGDLQRYKKIKEKENDIFFVSSFFRDENKIKRITLSPNQEKKVVSDCKRKCVVCSKSYEDRDNFVFHHINGDRSKSVTTNLALVCLRCHKKLHSLAKAKLKDYIITKGRTKSSGYGYEIKPIRSKPYKPPIYKL